MISLTSRFKQMSRYPRQSELLKRSFTFVSLNSRVQSVLSSGRLTQSSFSPDALSTRTAVTSSIAVHKSISSRHLLTSCHFTLVRRVLYFSRINFQDVLDTQDEVEEEDIKETWMDSRIMEHLTRSVRHRGSLKYFRTVFCKALSARFRGPWIALPLMAPLVVFPPKRRSCMSSKKLSFNMLASSKRTSERKPATSYDKSQAGIGMLYWIPICKYIGYKYENTNVET